MIMAGSHFGGLGLGLDFGSLLDPAGIFRSKDQPAADAGGAGGYVQCPQGMQPNPQWLSIPPAQRAQAAASGVQSCIPGGPGGAVDTSNLKLSVRFVTGGRAYPDFASALTAARATPTGGLIVRVHVLSQGKVVLRSSRDLAAAVSASGAVTTVGPGAPAGVIAATPGPGGVFTCPQGYAVARDAQGNVVCAPPSTGAARRRSSGDSRSARVRGGSRSRGRTMHGIEGVYGLGMAPSLNALDQGRPIFEIRDFAGRLYGSTATDREAYQIAQQASMTAGREVGVYYGNAMVRSYLSGRITWDMPNKDALSGGLGAIASGGAMYGMTFGEAEDTSTPIFDIREVASGMVRGSYASGSEAYQAAKQLSAAAGGVEVGVYVSGRKLFSYINGHMVGLNGPNLGDPVDMLALQQQAAQYQAAINSSTGQHPNLSPDQFGPQIPGYMAARLPPGVLPAGPLHAMAAQPPTDNVHPMARGHRYHGYQAARALHHDISSRIKARLARASVHEQALVAAAAEAGREVTHMHGVSLGEAFGYTRRWYDR